MKFSKPDALRLIRAMGWTARKTQYGIWISKADCLHKSEHGSECDTWEEALAPVQAEHERGSHCCSELTGIGKGR